MNKEYNLGNFIDDLSKYKEEFITVEFDDGSTPECFISWRGSYCELALTYTNKGCMDVDDLYRKSYNANNSIFIGYKGGEFIMDKDTPIHQANYGESGVETDDKYYLSKKIVGVEKRGDKLIIITRIDED